MLNNGTHFFSHLFISDFISQVLLAVHQGRFLRSLSFIAGISGFMSALEVTLEHYRGSFGQKIMYSPVVCCVILGVVGLSGAWSLWMAQKILPLASALLLLDGAVGFGFHIRGIARKPGGWSKNLVANIVMGPPLFAPLLLGISGVLGLVASQLNPEDSLQSLSPIHLENIRLCLAGATAISSALNGFDAFSSHYKSRFSSRSQWIPIILAPPLCGIGFWALFSPEQSQIFLMVFSCLAIFAGVLGAFFHANGVRKRAGDIHNLFYKIIYGPPLFAPLLFAASGFFGILAAQVGFLS